MYYENVGHTKGRSTGGVRTLEGGPEGANENWPSFRGRSKKENFAGGQGNGIWEHLSYCGVGGQKGQHWVR